MAKHRTRPHVELILEDLARHDSYPHESGEVRVIQTHISIVFLAGPYAYKVKKPVDLGFLDFSTLERRRWFCHQEVRLNRRLAPSVYHGVVPVVHASDVPHRLRVLDVLLSDPEESLDGSGEADASGDADETARSEEVVEWAVRMRRLPEARTLKALLRAAPSASWEDAVLERLARRIADFHARSERGDHVAKFAGFDAVAGNALDNFDELSEAAGETISAGVLRRLQELSGQALEALRPLIERRAREHVACDTHGDLRLAHVYVPEEAEEDILVVDCIEFNDRFRYADPISDIAFLVMELDFEGRPELARSLAERYLAAAGDAEGSALLPWFVTYRDIVRGKVRTLEARDPAVAPEDRAKSAARATRHFLRALGQLAAPPERPCLVLLSGLPGVGKSVLARGLSEANRFNWIDTDRVRRRIATEASIAATERARFNKGSFEQGIYTPEWTDRTYAACLSEADALLFEGKRVLVEGSFRAERHRKEFLAAARERGVPALLLVCEADRDVARERLATRKGDASEADWSIFKKAEQRWEEPGSQVTTALRRLRMEGSPEEALRRAERILEEEGLLAPEERLEGR